MQWRVFDRRSICYLDSYNPVFAGSVQSTFFRPIANHLMWSTQWYSKPYPIFQERERERESVVLNLTKFEGLLPGLPHHDWCLNHSNNSIAGYKVWIYPHHISMLVASNGYCPMVKLSFNSFNGLHDSAMPLAPGRSCKGDKWRQPLLRRRKRGFAKQTELLEESDKNQSFCCDFLWSGWGKMSDFAMFYPETKTRGRIVGFNGVSDAINEDTQYNQWRYNGNKHWNSLMCAIDPET